MDSLNAFTGVVRRCVADYGMISPGDRIAVGISGGKDSLVLLAALTYLRRYYPAPFELEGITIDTGFPGMDFSGVERMCEELGVPYTRVPRSCLTPGRRRTRARSARKCAAAR